MNNKRVVQLSFYGLMALSTFILFLLVGNVTVGRNGLGAVAAQATVSTAPMPPAVATWPALKEPPSAPTLEPVSLQIWTGSFWMDCRYVTGVPRGANYVGPAGDAFAHWSYLSTDERYRIGKACEGGDIWE